MKSKKRQPSGTYLAIKNDILRALLNSEYRHLSPKLEEVDLKFGQIIYTAINAIDYVYFPETAVVAMVDTVEDGGTVEVGIIGHELAAAYMIRTVMGRRSRSAGSVRRVQTEYSSISTMPERAIARRSQWNRPSAISSAPGQS
jgi:hypothetical protein